MDAPFRRLTISCLGLTVAVLGYQAEAVWAEDGPRDNCFTRSCVWDCPPQLEENCHEGCDPDFIYDCYYTTHCDLGMVEPYCWAGPDD
mgnify:FL=1